jgi:short-subunit dehydrogenase
MGLISVADMSDYCASKHAVIGFHDSLRQELNRNNSSVRTTMICPGLITTGMYSF